jgi:hypothetical protein
VLPMFRMINGIAPSRETMQRVTAAIAGDQAEVERLFAVSAGTIAPTAYFTPVNVERLLGAREAVAA